VASYGEFKPLKSYSGLVRQAISPARKKNEEIRK